MSATTLALVAVFVAEVHAAGMSSFQTQYAKQIQIESSWRTQVCSGSDACGWAQFVGPTYDELAPRVRPSCEGLERTDAACAVRLQILYIGMLLRRYDDAATRQDQWHMAWAAYVGGMGNVSKEIARCRRRLGCDPTRWYGHAEDECKRAAWACRDGKHYPRAIERVMMEGLK